MAVAQIISGNQLCFDKFEDAQEQYKHILRLLTKAGLQEALDTNTRVYSDLVRDFYNNGVFENGVLTSSVRGFSLRLKAKDFNRALGFVNDGLTSVNAISGSEGLQRMRHHKIERLHGLKKKEFPQKYEFLADIVGKCILCKDSAHDSVSDLQLRIMTAIVQRRQINYGALLLEWIGKRVQEQSTRKMFFGRFISILLKKLLKEEISENEGEALNVNKKITQRLFANWGNFTSDSKEGQSQVKPEESADVHQIRKGKRHIAETSHDSSAHPLPEKKRIKKAGRVVTPEPQQETELMAGMVSEPEPKEDEDEARRAASVEGEKESEPREEDVPSSVPEDAPFEGETHTDSEVEVIATGKSAERTHNYRCLYSFLPQMPFHRALVHQAWSQLFWTFRAYPNINIMAQAYPFQLHFAQHLLTNRESVGVHNKVTFIPYEVLISQSSSGQPANPEASSSQQQTLSSTQELQDAQPPVNPPHRALTSAPLILPGDIPSSSRNATQDSPPEDSTPADLQKTLQQILADIAERPTSDGMTELTVHLENQFHASIKASTEEVQQRLDDIVTGANKLPQFISHDVSSKIKEIITTMNKKDDLFLAEIAKHRRAVVALHQTQQETAQTFLKELFELKNSIRQQNERTDNAMALVHEQRQHADTFLAQQRNDITASQNQMQEILSAVQHISDVVTDDNKGEKSTRGDSRERSTRGNSRGSRSRVDQRESGDLTESERGRTRSERGRGSTRSSRPSQPRYPPPTRFDPHPSRTDVLPHSRASSSHQASLEDDLHKWSEDLRMREAIKIKEEEALQREEEELRKEEEERDRLLRRSRR